MLFFPAVKEFKVHFLVRWYDGVKTAPNSTVKWDANFRVLNVQKFIVFVFYKIWRKIRIFATIFSDPLFDISSTVLPI